MSFLCASLRRLVLGVVSLRRRRRRSPLEFRLTFDKAALDQPFTGRVFVHAHADRAGAAAARAQLVQPGAGVREGREGLEARRAARPSGPTRLAYPDAARGAEAGQVLRPGGDGPRPRRHQLRRQPGQRLLEAGAARARPEGDRRRCELKLDQVYKEPPFKETGDGQARGDREQAAHEVPRQADAAAGRRGPAAVVREGARTGSTRSSTRSPASAATTRSRPSVAAPQAVGRGRRRDDLGRPRRRTAGSATTSSPTPPTTARSARRSSRN